MTNPAETNAQPMPHQASLRAAGPILVWLAFGVALVLATKPVWSFWLLGFEPSLEDLLTLRCLPGNS